MIVRKYIPGPYVMAFETNFGDRPNDVHGLQKLAFEVDDKDYELFDAYDMLPLSTQLTRTMDIELSRELYDELHENGWIAVKEGLLADNKDYKKFQKKFEKNPDGVFPTR